MAAKDGVVKKTTLCFVFDRESNKLLMIEKKRGQGAGKWNVPGGKIQPGEDSETAAIRETREETGIIPLKVELAGKLEFYFPESDSWCNTCEVYRSEEFTGTLQPENDECSAHWIGLANIPFAKMWNDDKLWIPLLLAGKKFHRVYHFNAKDEMKSEQILDPVGD